MLLGSTRYALNRMNSVAIQNLMGNSISHLKNCKVGVYDFSVQGGAVGDINLLDEDGANLVIPAGAIIKETFIHVVTAVTSGGSATVAAKAAGAADVLAATAKTSFTLDALLDGKQDGTASKMILVGASDINPVITVAVAALTAGKIQVYFEYVRTLSL